MQNFQNFQNFQFDRRESLFLGIFRTIRYIWCTYRVFQNSRRFWFMRNFERLFVSFKLLSFKNYYSDVVLPGKKVVFPNT